MPIRPAFLLTVCAGLSLAIGGEVLVGIGEAPAMEIATAAPHAAKPNPPDIASASLIEPILARPLFDPSRRPPAIPVVARTAPSTTPPPQARLAGTITTTEAHVAFFTPTGGKPLSLEIGGEISGWHVIAIYPGRVTLRSDDGSLLVKTMTGTTTPIVVSALRNWKPPVFHHEE